MAREHRMCFFLESSHARAPGASRLPRLPAATPLPDALSLLRQNNSHLALLTGADGAVSGLLALEDLVEDVVGTVRDGVHR